MRKNATLFRQEAPFTVRGDPSASDFPRLYKAESLDISLHLTRSSSGNYVLMGILTSVSESANAFEQMDAELYAMPGPYVRDGDEQAATPLFRTQIDDLGHMVFREVPEGEYMLILRLSGLDVVIEGLSIGQH
jgi:hypothetical protein